MKMFLVVNIY